MLNARRVTPSRVRPPRAVRQEGSHDLGPRHGPASQPQGRDLHPPVHAAPGADQPGEPAPAVCAAPARPRSRLGRDGHPGHRHRSRLEWGDGHAPRGVQGPDRPCHPRRGRHRPLLRGDPARAELLGLVPAAGPMWLPTMPHWRSRWRVRSGLGQWPPPPGPEGCDLGGGTAHVTRPPDGWPARPSAASWRYCYRLAWRTMAAVGW
jgi:hypothetical protein